MAAPRPSKTRIGNHVLRRETLMLSYGYDPMLSEGAVKPPVFLTSTFVFGSAEEGRGLLRLYRGAARSRPKAPAPASSIRASTIPTARSSRTGSRSTKAQSSCVLFSSGMAAISAVLLAFARPGDSVLHTRPLYGGTHGLLDGPIAGIGVTPVAIGDALDPASVDEAADTARGTGRSASSSSRRRPTRPTASPISQ